MMRYLTLLLSFALLPLFTQAQEQEIPAKKQYHQIFLDGPVKKVKSLEYIDSEKGSIEFQLSEDKTAIYLMDYDGEGGVRARVEDIEGKEQEVTRSKCHIHTLPEL